MNIRSILGFSLGPLIGAMLSFVTIPILTWIFSQDDIGRLSMLQVVLSFSTILFSLGLDQAYVRDYHEASNKPELLRSAILPGLLLLIVLLGVLLMASPSAMAQMLFSLDDVVASLMVACCIVGAYVSRFLSLILRMNERGLAYSMSQILPKMLLLSIVGVYAIFVVHQKFELLLLAQMSAIILAAVVFSWNTRDEWLAACRARIDTARLSPMFGFGLPLILGGVASWALYAIDRIFLRSMSSYEELAVYSVAASAASAVTIFAGIFNTIWAPMAYKWVANGVDMKVIERIIDELLALMAIIFGLTGGLSWLVTYLLPESYVKVSFILVGCMAGPLFYTLSEVTAIGLGISRKTIYSMMASLVAVIVALCGNFLLIPSFGAIGATISTAVAFWAFLVARTEFSCRAWKKIPRAKVYASTFLLVILVVVYALCGPHYPRALIAVWWIFTVWALWNYRKIYIEQMRRLQRLIANRSNHREA